MRPALASLPPFPSLPTGRGQQPPVETVSLKRTESLPEKMAVCSNSDSVFTALVLEQRLM